MTDLLFATLLTVVLACAGVWTAAMVDVGVEHWAAGRGWRPIAAALAPVRMAAAMSIQRPTSTERPDIGAWALAPALLAGLAALSLALVPFGPGLVIADPTAGFVVFSAAVAFVMIAVFLHGWAPNSVFAIHGAYRYGAVALSFQIPFLLAMLATVLPAESLSMVAIADAQQGAWNVIRQPLGLPIYLIVGLAVSFWGPLDLPDGADIAGGTASEDAGASRLLWQLARLAMLVAVAAMGATAFLGSWWGPLLPGPVWVLLKTALLVGVLSATRHLFARYRIEPFVRRCWIVLIPLALLNILVAGVTLL
jgi:NADH-quinone oxidoreductase subunit H